MFLRLHIGARAAKEAAKKTAKEEGGRSAEISQQQQPPPSQKRRISTAWGSPPSSSRREEEKEGRSRRRRRRRASIWGSRELSQRSVYFAVPFFMPNMRVQVVLSSDSDWSSWNADPDWGFFWLNADSEALFYFLLLKDITINFICERFLEFLLRPCRLDVYPGILWCTLWVLRSL